MSPSVILHQSISPIDISRLKKEVEKVWRDEEGRVLEASRLIAGHPAGSVAGEFEV